MASLAYPYHFKNVLYTLLNKFRTKSSWIIGWKLSTLHRCSSTEKQIILHIILYQFQISYRVKKYFRINWKVKIVKNYFFLYRTLFQKWKLASNILWVLFVFLCRNCKSFGIQFCFVTGLWGYYSYRDFTTSTTT